MEFKAGKKIYLFVIIIGLLMIANAVLTFENSKRIHRNQRLLEKTEQVKINAQGILTSLHLLDLGIRAYVLLSEEAMYTSPKDSSKLYLNQHLAYLESTLPEQRFSMAKFDTVRYSVKLYYSFITEKVEAAAREGDFEKAKALIAEDRGYELALLVSQFIAEINEFEDQIAAKAEASFKSAINQSYWLQIILFFITMPTLLYAAFFSVKSLRYSEQLRRAEHEKASILTNQNTKLELLVRERTDEILASNEEIRAQNEEISTQNEEIVFRNKKLVEQQQIIDKKNRQLEAQNTELREAKSTIEQQQKLLLLRVDELDEAISRQNEELINTNSEVIAQNTQLQQFAYIISHNLRAPIARLLGLGDLVERESDPEEKERIIKLMRLASKDLNEVISDIGQVLLIQKAGNIFEKVNLQETLDKVRKILTKEIAETKARIQSNFSAVKVIYSLPAYVESIFLNLISNSIKYRKPGTIPEIVVSTSLDERQLSLRFKDNGMGINLERDQHNLFGLYKRFYFHVEGKGLGLYLVKTQVEALGGTIQVKSELGKGTEFLITFQSAMVQR